MITLLVISAHLFFDILFGWSVLNLRRHQRSWAETLLLSVLVGMYVETLFVATLLFFGIHLVTAGIVAAAVMGGIAIAALYRGRQHRTPVSIEGPKWYELALLVSVSEKVLFAFWQLARTDTYFDDALRHWSGRARALFGELNWSFDMASPHFLGGHIGNSSYPLQIIIWRALSAELYAEWNEVLSRADGLVFFLVVLGSVWLAVWRFSQVRWLAAAAAFVVSAVPLHAWHAAAGYSDIAVEAFAVAALACLLRSEWFLSGVMAAGAAWSKNDGLVLYFPSMVAAAVLLQWRRETAQLRLRNVGWFLLGFATIAPWLIFNYSHSLGLTSGLGEFAWHSDAPRLLWNAVMTGPTSNILWIFVFAAAIYAGVAMFKDSTGRALLSAFMISLAGIVFIFTFTSAYMFLKDETTIHRVLMQLSGIAVLVVTYGIWLKTPSGEWSRAPERHGARNERPRRVNPRKRA